MPYVSPFHEADGGVHFEKLQKLVIVVKEGFPMGSVASWRRRRPGARGQDLGECVFVCVEGLEGKRPGGVWIWPLHRLRV